MTKILTTAAAVFIAIAIIGYAAEEATSEPPVAKVVEEVTAEVPQPAEAGFGASASKPVQISGKKIISKQRSEEIIIRDGEGNALIKFYFTYREQAIPGKDQPASLIITDGQGTVFVNIARKR